MHMQPTLGELIKHARLEAGLTQEALAARSGLSARAISDLERNVSQAPRTATLRLLVAALALSPHEREYFEAVARAAQARGRDDGGAPTSPAPEDGELVPEAPGVVDLATRAPLFGRAAELEVIEQHLSGDGPPLLVVEGEAGIGKTRLLEAATAMAVRRGLNVLQGTTPAGSQQALGDPILDALRRVVETRSPVRLRRDLQGCAWLVRVLPELAFGPLESLPTVSMPSEQESALIARAVQRFVSNTAAPGGTLLTLDNLQHAEPPALERLAILVQSTSGVPLRIIGAFRDGQSGGGDPLSSLLASLAHEQRVRHLKLRSLSTQQSAALLVHLASPRAVTRATLSRVVRETGGVPFYVVAWAHDLQRADLEPAADHVPWPIRLSVRDRMHALAGVPSVLEAIAIAGGRADYPLLAAICREPESEVLAALESAMREHLVDEDRNAFRFAYGVIRAAIDADLSHARRVLLRRRLSAALPEARHDRPVSRRAAFEQTRREEWAQHLAVLRRRRGRA
jgi:transcriptional regulator with XRE-family HTH domain